MAIVEVDAPDGVAGGLVAEVVFLRQGFLVQVHHRGTQVEVGLKLIVEVHAQHTLARHAETVVLRTHADGGVGGQDALVDDAHSAHGVVDGVVYVFYQRHTPGGHRHTARAHAVAQRYFPTHSRGIVTLKIEPIAVCILLGEGLGHGVERVEAIAVGHLVVGQQPSQVLAEGFHIGEEHTSRGGLDDTALEGGRVEPVEHSVGIVVALGGVHAVQPEHLYEGLALLRSFGEEADAHASLATLVEDVEPEVFPAYLTAFQEVDIFHHQAPQRAVGVGGGAFEEFHHQGGGVVHSVGGQFAHLIHRGVAHHLILEGHGQHLVVGQRLVEGDEAQLPVEGVLVGGQQAGALHLLVVGAGHQSEALHVALYAVDVAYGVGVHQLEQGVGVVGGEAHTGAREPGIGGRGLAQVGQGQQVAVLCDGGAHVGAPHFETDDLHVAPHHRQRGHGFVVVVVEVLREEVVAVFLVLVGPYLELVAAGAAFHLQVLGAGLLLAQHGVDGQFAEFQLRVEAEELLAAVDEACAQRKRDVGSLEQLQYVVLLALVLELYHVLEVEGGLGVLVEVEVDEVAYLGVEVQLYVLVEVERVDVAFVACHVGVVAEVVHQLEYQLGAAGGVDLGLDVDAVEFLANLGKAGQFAQQSVARVVEGRPFGLAVPVVAHQPVHLPGLVFLECHIAPLQDHVAHLRGDDIVITPRPILDGGLHPVGGEAAPHRAVALLLRPHHRRGHQEQ